LRTPFSVVLFDIFVEIFVDNLNKINIIVINEINVINDMW